MLSGLLGRFRKRGAEEPGDQDVFEGTEESVDGDTAANAHGAEAKAPVDHLTGVVKPGLNTLVPLRKPTADRRPRIAITVTSLGLPPRSTEAALQALPPGVTLFVFSNYPGLTGVGRPSVAKGT